MRRMAFDWTLSRRQREDFGAPPQTWEQYSKEGQTWKLYIDRFECAQLIMMMIKMEGEKMRKTRGLWRRNRASEMHVLQWNGCEFSK